MLRRVLFGIGLLVVVVLTLVACVWLRSTYDSIGVIALAGCSGTAAWVCSVMAKGIAEDAAYAIWDLRLSLKEAAAQIGMDIGQASRQVTGVQRLDYAKWSELDGWEVAFMKRRAERSQGYTVHVNGIVAAALAELTRLLDRKATAA